MAKPWYQLQWSLLLFICVACYFVFKLLRYGHREKHLPPGPPTLPILGNAHLLVAGRVFLRSVLALVPKLRQLTLCQVQGME